MWVGNPPPWNRNTNKMRPPKSKSDNSVLCWRCGEARLEARLVISFLRRVSPKHSQRKFFALFSNWKPQLKSHFHVKKCEKIIKTPLGSYEIFLHRYNVYRWWPRKVSPNVIFRVICENFKDFPETHINSKNSEKIYSIVLF